MKSIFSFFLILGAIIFLPNPAHACFGFGCNTDLAILGEVLSLENNIATVKPFHVFPNSKIPNQNEIKIEDTNRELQIDKKYAFALRKKDEIYTPVWRILEVEGDSFENVKLLSLKNGDDAWLQWWINRNGKEPEVNFHQINNKLFIRIGNVESSFFRDVQVYPERLPIEHLLLIIVGSFLMGMGGMGSTYFLFMKKKKTPGGADGN